MPYKDPERRKQRDNERYAANAEAVRTKERNRYDANQQAIRERRKKLSPKHLAKNAQRERERYSILRLELISAYGSACACCGESEPLFLELDHSNGDGAAHRRAIGRGAKACYSWLKRRGYPRDGFQLLCANCNQGRKRNGGTCPHEADPVFRANGEGNSGGQENPN